MASINIQQMMADSGVAFGTSGARGLVSQMTDQVCAAYTLAFLQGLKLAKPGQKIALGMDLRPSSPTIVQACAAAIKQAGCETIFCGALPTPALAFYAMSQHVPAIMVTGSHIPFDRNGIKFYRAEGEISKADEAAITQAVVNVADFGDDKLPAVDFAALEQYKRRYTDLFAADLLSGWRIGIYEHSSVARDCLRGILTALAAEVISLARTDTFVPIDTEAVSEIDRQRGLDWAQQLGLDAIISTDGDGDRPLIADETGNWLRGDIVGLLCAQFLGADTVVTPVSCNTAIEASGVFKRVIRTRIGSPYVIAGMEQAETNGGGQGVAGFEANGGFLAGHGLTVAGRMLAALPTRDAVLPALVLLAMAKLQRCKLSALTANLPKRYTSSDRLQDFPAADSRALLAQLQQDDTAYQSLWGTALGTVARRDLTDGLRLTFTNGEIVHLRPSGNAPELRCYTEADNMPRAQALVTLTLREISSKYAS
ncbi:MAG: phosphomannomutase [Methylomonas sp.]|jgi:phosphomannomutase|uniref:phosphomannomutase n=1 Tax=Methylomonas sp. TaxID=418 RepID=UPI0025F05B60|nr:phosphomannomutase [Methylomonas sp.]MCK9608401.1 phosphomannomutase [Methylomonas sp.]